MSIKRIAFGKQELRYLECVWGHLMDYAAGDDRMDHGWNRIKGIRESHDSQKEMLRLVYYRVARGMRLYRK